MSLLKGADKYDDQVTVVMTILGNSEEIKKFFWFPAGITKTKTYCRFSKRLQLQELICNNLAVQR